MLLAIADHPSSEETDRLKLLLLREGYKVAGCQPGPDLPEKLSALKPAGIVLITSEPKEARETLKAVRAAEAAGGPVIFCVHLSRWPTGAVDCLEAGADDFLSKPFNPEVFLARVRALLRRPLWAGAAAWSGDPGSRLEEGPLAMNLLTRQAFVSGKPLPLTRLEFDLLAHLISRKDSVLSRRAILQAVWHHPEDVEVDTRTVDKHVESLRSKLGSAGRMIKTVRGNGYFLSPEPAPQTK